MNVVYWQLMGKTDLESIRANLIQVQNKLSDFIGSEFFLSTGPSSYYAQNLKATVAYETAYNLFLKTLQDINTAITEYPEEEPEPGT